MCKPSCCNPKKNSDSAAVTVIVLIVAAAIVAVKIGPFLAEAGRILAGILLAALAAASVAALAAVVWAVMRLTRRARRQQHANPVIARPVAARLTGRERAFIPVSEQACLACGDKGHVVRVFGNGTLMVRPCPECQPDRITG